MKTIIIILLFSFVHSANAQIAFVSKIGTPQHSALTMLYNDVDIDKTLLYYNGYDSPPALITMLKDTTISNVRLALIKIGELPYKYFISFDGLRSISLYNEQFQLIGDYTNDSLSWNNLNRNTKKPNPILTPQQMFTAFKYLLLLL